MSEFAADPRPFRNGGYPPYLVSVPGFDEYSDSGMDGTLESYYADLDDDLADELGGEVFSKGSPIEV